MIGTFLTLAVAATTAAFDSTSYVVLNHGRRAGDMTIVSQGDSTVARWIFTDRNRGTRLETRYRYNAAKQIVSGDIHTIAANGAAGPALQSFDLRGDSVHFSPAAAERAEP